MRGTRAITRRTSALLAAGALAFGGAACGDDVVDDSVESEVEEGVEEVEEGVEDAGDEAEDAIDGEGGDGGTENEG